MSSHVPRGIVVEELEEQRGAASSVYRETPRGASGRRLVLTCRWRNSTAAQALVAFGLVVPVLAVRYLADPKVRSHDGSTPVVALLCGLSVLLAVLAVAIVRAHARTRVTVTADSITVEHLGFLADPRVVTVATEGIIQLFVQRRVVPKGRSRIEVSDLIAIHGDGKQQPLLEDVTDYSRLRFVERRIESWLGIVNVPVPGERPIP